MHRQTCNNISIILCCCTQWIEKQDYSSSVFFLSTQYLMLQKSQISEHKKSFYQSRYNLVEALAKFKTPNKN